METFIYFLLVIAFGGMAFGVPIVLKKESYFKDILVYMLLMVALVFWVIFLCRLV